jgi:multimeric flavodoxin WrbA
MNCLSQLKAFFDRAVSFRRNGFRWENLISGALSVGRSRHGGQELTLFDIHRAALINGMIVVLS